MGRREKRGQNKSPPTFAAPPLTHTNSFDWIQETKFSPALLRSSICGHLTIGLRLTFHRSVSLFASFIAGAAEWRKNSSGCFFFLLLPDESAGTGNYGEMCVDIQVFLWVGGGWDDDVVAD